jgi:hypothetical protein
MTGVDGAISFKQALLINSLVLFCMDFQSIKQLFESCLLVLVTTINVHSSYGYLKMYRVDERRSCDHCILEFKLKDFF